MALVIEKPEELEKKYTVESLKEALKKNKIEVREIGARVLEIIAKGLGIDPKNCLGYESTNPENDNLFGQLAYKLVKEEGIKAKYIHREILNIVKNTVELEKIAKQLKEIYSKNLEKYLL
jgi:hypothetical protein